MIMNQSAFPCHSFPSKISVSALSFTFLAILFFKCFYAPIWKNQRAKHVFVCIWYCINTPARFDTFPFEIFKHNLHFLSETYWLYHGKNILVADKCSFQHVQPHFDSRKSNTMTNRTSSTSFFLGGSEAQYDLRMLRNNLHFMGTCGDFNFI